MNISEKLIKEIVEKVVAEAMAKDVAPKADFEKHVDPSGIISIKGSSVKCERFEQDGVALKDLLTLEEAPRMGAGIMEVDNTSFEWTLTYDEYDYVIEGTLEIVIDGRVITAHAGDIIYIPKNSHIHFRSRNGKARYFYTVYPANWLELIGK